MTVYKSSVPILIKNVVYALSGGALAMLITSWLVKILPVIIALGALVFLGLLYYALIGDNLTVVVDGSKIEFFRIFGKKPIHSFELDKVTVYAKHKNSFGESYCALVFDDGSGKGVTIDCSMMGTKRFAALMDTLNIPEDRIVPVFGKVK